MITCGIDVGARTVKVVVMDGGRVLGKSSRVVDLDVVKDIEGALADALAAAKVTRDAVKSFVATGSGRESVAFAPHRPTGISCAARGIFHLYPETRMVIDIGAEEGRAIQCDAAGKVLNFVINEKCAAGAGTFIESMSRTLEIGVADFGPLALKSKELVPMNAQCAVFAESEVVSLIHTKTPREDIARAVCEAMAGRIGSMSRRISITPPVALVGGVARNVALVRALEGDLKTDLKVPADPEFVPAIGAAILATEE